eukprot:10266786-Alexandrium_andersonii.AAC.1
MGDAGDGNSLRGVLARILGQATYPDPGAFARASEEDYRQALKDHGYFERCGADGPVKTPIGLMDKGRLLGVRAQ